MPNPCATWTGTRDWQTVAGIWRILWRGNRRDGCLEPRCGAAAATPDGRKGSRGPEYDALVCEEAAVLVKLNVAERIAEAMDAAGTDVPELARRARCLRAEAAPRDAGRQRRGRRRGTRAGARKRAGRETRCGTA